MSDIDGTLQPGLISDDHRIMLFASLDADTVEKVAFVMIGVIAIISVLILRSHLRAATKIALIAALAGLGVGLFQNRVELGRCSQTCSCAIYGQHVDVPHLPFSCNY